VKREDVFDAWSPSDSRWSAWAKPVLFASLPEERIDEPGQMQALDIDARWLMPLGAQSGSERTSPHQRGAVVVDLPGAKSVRAGLALARIGFRPVPLFNALPGDSESLVDVLTIQHALAAGAAPLREEVIQADAPPAFLLDSLRRAARHAIAPGRFDNRSVVLSTDLPSSAWLLDAGIRHVTLLREGSLRPDGDLSSILAAYRAHGIAIQVKDLETEGASVACPLPRWPALSRLWFQTLGRLGLRRQSSGEFGGVIRSAG
jgi:hypothetical protein